MKQVNFSVSVFMENISFVDTKFIQKANFEQTIFVKSVDFRFSIFLQDANFEETTFEGDANFYNSTFKQKADFINATLIQNAIFDNTTFLENVDFWGTTFKQLVNFSDSKFMGNLINFNRAKFLKPINPESLFSFAHTIFQTKVNFSESTFEHLPDLTGTDFRSGINLDKVGFPPDLKSPPSLGEGMGGGHNIESGGREHTDIEQKNELSSPPPNLPQRGRDKNDCPIRGGLPTYEDAKITWHALQTEMEKAGYHEQAVTYFGYELDAKYLDDKTDTIFKWVLWFYKKISDYGQSITKPVYCWVGLIGVFWFLHSFAFFFTYFCGVQSDFSTVQEILISLQLSFKGAFPFISDQTTFFDRMFRACGHLSQMTEATR